MVENVVIKIMLTGMQQKPGFKEFPERKPECGDRRPEVRLGPSGGRGEFQEKSD